MTHEETIQKLIELRMLAMVRMLRDWLAQPTVINMTFEEQLALLVDREWVERQNRALERRIKDARLPMQASVDDFWSETGRGIDRGAIRAMQSCQWIHAKQNVVIIGATGVGKSYLAAALAHAACINGYRATYQRTSRLVQQLAVARADGSYPTLLSQLAKTHVLVLDDFLLAPLTDVEKRDLLEILEDRYGRLSTIITSQLPTKSWHESLGDPTMADAICDRLVHNAHVITLRGGSMRKKKGMGSPTEATATT